MPTSTGGEHVRHSRLINSGQSCINAKRFIVVESLVAAFTEKLVAAMKSQQMGDPMAEGTEVGPQARRDLRDELHKQVVDSVAKGARAAPRRRDSPRARLFYPPTVFSGVAGHARRTKRNYSVRSHRSLRPATKPRRFGSRTTASSGWAQLYLRGTLLEANGSPVRWRRGAPLSTRWSPPIPVCRLGASRNLGTAASSVATG